MQILIVDDDSDVRLSLRTALVRRGHRVWVAADAAEALRAARAETPDAAVVDLMLPDIDGFALCRRLREEHAFPLLMLTARDDDADVVGGLEAGADDYVVKPVGAAVLEARLRALLRRRREPGPVTEVLEHGALRMDLHAHAVTVGDHAVGLSATEFALLEDLLGHTGIVRSRGELVDSVWRENPPSSERVVDTTMQRLRLKLDEHPGAPEILTLRGVGYLMP